jgi:hypothetical protein
MAISFYSLLKKQLFVRLIKNVSACGGQGAPAFAEAPALRKASGGGATRRQAKS